MHTCVHTVYVCVFNITNIISRFFSPFFVGLACNLTGLLRFILPTDQTELLSLSVQFSRSQASCNLAFHQAVAVEGTEMCMTTVWVESSVCSQASPLLKRISRCTSLACACCQAARLNFDRFNSSRF